MRISLINFFVAAVFVGAIHLRADDAAPPLPHMEVGTFEQEVSQKYGIEQGLPDADVRAIAVTKNNDAYAGTAKGVARFDRATGRWESVTGLEAVPIVALAARDTKVYAASESTVYEIDGIASKVYAVWPKTADPRIPEAARITCLSILPGGTGVDVGTQAGLFRADERGTIEKREGLNEHFPKEPGFPVIRQVATSGQVTALATQQGLFEIKSRNHPYEQLYPFDGPRSWAVNDVRGAAFDHSGNLWFASPQGAGVRIGDSWKLYDGSNGLPYDDFTCVAAGPDDRVWFGTTWGAIAFDGKTWEYRNGKRWLPGDRIRGIAVDSKGTAWFATDKGVGVIERVPMTLKEKAKRFEEQIDKYHRRTPYEYVLSVTLNTPGDLNGGFKQRDSDNDGLWTSMYGAGECFAYAATGDPKAKERAKKAFEAMRFLGLVTQGGELSPPKGFVARSILPTDGPDPNVGRDDAKKQREDDALWKTHVPWWPKSKDGKWYWKSDTSSDELDGHYFLYAAYYDLVADTEDEKQHVRDHVLALTDHLIEHDFDLVDYDGKPTRWARYSPKTWDDVASWWAGRGLNSLSILSYLKVAEHISGGNKKYADAYNYLVDKFQYAANMMVPKWQMCPGCGNQSDDEMGFMSFYNLMKYETDPQRRQTYAYAFYNYWMIEEPELNPLFNFMYASQGWGVKHVNPWGPIDVTPQGPWLEDSIDTLKRYPLDRINWGTRNSHRKDLVPLAAHTRERGGERGRGYRRSGYVLPIDERVVEHWNHDPWVLDYRGNGETLMDPASFLLPYYMGLYHGFIVEH